MSGTEKAGLFFWVIAIVSLLWNGMGAMNFAMQLSPDGAAGFPENYQEVINNRPPWATVAFGLGAAASVIGSILLLMRRRLAYFAFIVAFLSVLGTLLYSAPMQFFFADFTFAENVMTILLPILVSAFLIWYTNRARLHGVLR